MIESRKYCIRIVSKVVSKAQSLYLKQTRECCPEENYWLFQFLNYYVQEEDFYVTPVTVRCWIALLYTFP